MFLENIENNLIVTVYVFGWNIYTQKYNGNHLQFANYYIKCI